MKKAKVTIAGKEYDCEIVGGIHYIDGKTIDEFLDTVTIPVMEDLAEVGMAALRDEKKGTKPRKYQQMMKCSHIRRNN